MGRTTTTINNMVRTVSMCNLVPILIYTAYYYYYDLLCNKAAETQLHVNNTVLAYNTSKILLKT